MSNSKNGQIVKLLKKYPGIDQRAAEKKLGFTMAPSTLWRARKSLETTSGVVEDLPKPQKNRSSLGDMVESLTEESSSDFDGFFGAPLKGLPKLTPHRPAVTVKKVFNVGPKVPAGKDAESGTLLRVFRFGAVDAKAEGSLQRILDLLAKTSGVEMSLARVSPSNDLEVRVSVDSE